MRATKSTHWGLRILYLLARVHWWIFRPLTMGVKLMLIRDETVLMVRHTYQEGWFLPGGGVKRGEFVAAAAHREAGEELGAALHDLSLFGIYTNNFGRRNDQITVFTAHDFQLGALESPEIAAVGFFPLDELPVDASPASQRRLREYRGLARGGRPFVRTW